MQILDESVIVTLTLIWNAWKRGLLSITNLNSCDSIMKSTRIRQNIISIKHDWIAPREHCTYTWHNTVKYASRALEWKPTSMGHVIQTNHLPVFCSFWFISLSIASIFLSLPIIILSLFITFTFFPFFLFTLSSEKQYILPNVDVIAGLVCITLLLIYSFYGPKQTILVTFLWQI